jgi:hypothetical protein
LPFPAPLPPNRNTTMPDPAPPTLLLPHAPRIPASSAQHLQEAHSFFPTFFPPPDLSIGDFSNTGGESRVPGPSLTPPVHTMPPLPLQQTRRQQHRQRRKVSPPFPTSYYKCLLPPTSAGSVVECEFS